MTPQASRLLVCALAFAGWLGYLAYQVYFTRPLTAGGAPLVLSRPQLLTADLDVIAEVPDARGPATVRRVLRGEGEGVAVDGRLDLPNLEACRAPQRIGEVNAGPPDWSGPGLYLIPLSRAPRGGFQVAPVPTSPGFTSVGPPRIYPVTPETLAQYDRARADRE